MANPNFLITTPRLYISHLDHSSPEHCDFLVALHNSPPFIAMNGGQPTSVTSRETASKLIAARYQPEHVRNGFLTYLVSLKPTSASSTAPTEEPEENPDRLRTATPIGIVTLIRGLRPDCYECPDLGFAMMPEHMRKGYAKEASLGLLEWAEREKGVKDVLGMHNPANEGSAAVFRSLGFEDRGLRVLRVFGGEVGRVWTKRGMGEDLSVYGLPRDPPGEDDKVGSQEKDEGA